MKTFIKLIAIIGCLLTIIISLILVLPMFFSEEFNLTQRIVALGCVLILNISLLFLTKEALTLK